MERGWELHTHSFTHANKDTRYISYLFIREISTNGYGFTIRMEECGMVGV